MKRNLLLLLLTAALAGQGCVGMDKLPWERETTDVKAPTSVPAPVPTPAPPPLVTDQGVTEANAAQVAAALGTELDRAMSEPTAQPAPAVGQPRP